MVQRFSGSDVIILPEPRPPYRVRPRVPSKKDGRRGTRRAWKRKHPPYTVAEVPSLPVGEALSAPGRLYMRAQTFRDLQAAIAQRQAQPAAGAYQGWPS